MTKREKQIVDALMDGLGCSKSSRVLDALSETLGLSNTRVRHLVRSIQLKYGIDYRKYIPTVRIVYLRAKELGLIRDSIEWQNP